MRSAESATPAFVGGIAANRITTFWWKRKGGSGSGGSGTKIHRFRIPDGKHTGVVEAEKANLINDIVRGCVNLNGRQRTPLRGVQ